MYRPPRDIIDNKYYYHTFFSELVPTLTQFNNSKSEVVIAGDFNLDLLKLNENNIVSNFFDTITSEMFHPTSTLPARFSDKRCTLLVIKSCNNELNNRNFDKQHFGSSTIHFKHT